MRRIDSVPLLSVSFSLSVVATLDDLNMCSTRVGVLSRSKLGSRGGRALQCVNSMA